MPRPSWLRYTITPITVSRCKELDLPHQVTDNTSVLGTPFTVTVDKLEGCTTGVSAADRAATIQALADPLSTPATFGRPGHINPLYAQEKGVLRRAGHTEATIDMCRLSGFYPAGALMEIMNEDGSKRTSRQALSLHTAYSTNNYGKDAHGHEQLLPGNYSMLSTTV